MILCDVNKPIFKSGYIDDVLATNISVSPNSTSLSSSHVPIVPLLFAKTLILDISPVAGSRLLICKTPYDSEF